MALRPALRDDLADRDGGGGLISMPIEPES